MAALDVDAPATERLFGHRDYQHKPMRFVVESWSAKGHGTFLTGAATREDAEHIGGAALADAWQPVALYDLDELRGEAPEPDEGDTIRVGDGVFVVTSTDTKDGGLTVDFWEGEHPRWAYADSVEVIERAEPDDRLPVRFPLARLAVFVAFNSTPEG
jgi:hypothetical protein